MTMVYKVTDADGYTQRGRPGETLWTAGVWVEVPWSGELGSAGCLHAYCHPLLAAMLAPIDGWMLPGGLLWEAEGNVLADDGTQLGCDRLRVLHKLAVPTVTVAQRVRWSFLCDLARCTDERWRRFVERWLSKENRSVPYVLAVVDSVVNRPAISRASYGAAEFAASIVANNPGIDAVALAKRAILEES